MQCVYVTRKAPEDIHIIFTDKAGEDREKKVDTSNAQILQSVGHRDCTDV